MTRVVLLTGVPGVGKTTMVDRVCKRYSSLGVKVGGFTTREVREGVRRMGFKITDLASGKEGWLARREEAAGVRVGSYRVVSDDLERIAVTSLEMALKEPVDLVILDEIGPMEMTSSSFRAVVSEVFAGNTTTLATVKLGSRYPEVEKIRERSLQLEMTKNNREEIYQEIVDRIDDWFRISGS